MINGKAKGYRTVRAGNKIFEEQGFLCANLERTGRFIKEKDLFGLWDNLYIRGKLHIFVQYKSNKKVILNNGKPAKWTVPYFLFGKKHSSRYVKYEIWNKKDRGGFEVVRCE